MSVTLCGSLLHICQPSLIYAVSSLDCPKLTRWVTVHAPPVRMSHNNMGVILHSQVNCCILARASWMFGSECAVIRFNQGVIVGRYLPSFVSVPVDLVQ